MMKFTWIDLVLILAYVATVLYLGYSAGKKHSHEDFLISGRKLKLLSGIATINATKTGAILLVYTALLYLYGFSALWYFIGIFIGYLVFIPFAEHLHKKSSAQYYTLADYFYHNYGKIAAYNASVITIIVMLGGLLINLIAAAKVFQFLSGIEFWLSCIIISGVVLVYLLLGGFKAVVKTDFLQYTAIVFVLVVFAVILWGTPIPKTELTIFASGAKNIFGFVLLGLLFPFASPDLWQRVYAMPDIKTLKKSILYSIIVYFAVGIVLTLVGLLIKTQLPGLDPDIALISGFATLLPTGLAGLAVIIFFAAFMSSIDTYVYTAASAIIQDFSKHVSKKETVKRIRYTILGLVVLITLAGILLADIIIGTYIFTAFISSLAVPTVATWIKPSIDKRIISINMITSLGLVFIILITDILNNNVTPLLVIKGLGAAILGLIIGWLYTKIKKN